jgi:transcriptional regulator GlxA family with amidase domain
MDQRIEIVMSRMKADLHQKPSLEKLARRVGLFRLSPSRLRHLFKAPVRRVRRTQQHCQLDSL